MYLPELTEISQMLGHTVKLEGGRIIVPGDDEYRRILDKAAEVLYAEPVGATLRIARLIVERQTKYYDVYIHVGSYK